jgi:hypothetical protein
MTLVFESVAFKSSCHMLVGSVVFYIGYFCHRCPLEHQLRYCQAACVKNCHARTAVGKSDRAATQDVAEYNKTILSIAVAAPTHRNYLTMLLVRFAQRNIAASHWVAAILRF